MTSALEIVDQVYGVLKTRMQEWAAENGRAFISGALYKHTDRPLASLKEDITVACLANVNAQLQEAVVNVNCYAPNLQLKRAGTVDGGTADHKRLKEMAGFVEEWLEDYWSPEGWHCALNGDTVFKEEKEHYINIRIKIFNHNINLN